MIELKTMRFQITRRFRCMQCHDAWTCAMDIHPTGNVLLENLSVRTLLEKSLKASCSDLFDKVVTSDLKVDEQLLNTRVRDCEELVKIECKHSGLFLCPTCTYPGQSRPTDYSQQTSSGISTYSLSFHNLDAGSTDESLGGGPRGSSVTEVLPPSFYPSSASRPLPPLPSPGTEAPVPPMSCRIMDNIFHHTTSKGTICNALQLKEQGSYAVVRLEVSYGGGTHHNSPFIILCLQMRHGYKVVLQDSYGQMFIHLSDKFKTLNSLIQYYETHPTKCGTILTRQLTKEDLTAHRSNSLSRTH